jgi:uncharacterized membrane protein
MQHLWPSRTTVYSSTSEASLTELASTLLLFPILVRAGLVLENFVKFFKIFHQIFGHMHKALNIDKNKINYTV